MVPADAICPFKDRNSVGVPCQITCNEPNDDGLINCAIARLDDSNYKYLYELAEYELLKIGDFEPV